MRHLALILVSASFLLSANIAKADITVGLSTAMTGLGATIGRGYRAGIEAAQLYMGSVGGEKIKVIVLDDASDQSTASRNARKLIDEDKVDILLGTSGVPSTLAMAAVAAEKKVPMIALSPVSPRDTGAGQWVVTVPQSNPFMILALVDHMKAAGIKRVAYIGYSDALGDDVYQGLVDAAQKAGIEVVTNERFARADTSVTGQVIRILSTQPDAVMTGGAGTAGALPYLTLRQRGYNKPIFGPHSLINPEFIRVGGPAVQGTIVPSGPVVVAEQLEDSNPTKKVALAFREYYQKANNQEAKDSLSPYAFDAWLIMADAAKRVLAKGVKPGTAEFRAALRDAILQTSELVGTHGVYNFKPGAFYGVDERARVLIKLDGPSWKYVR